MCCLILCEERKLTKEEFKNCFESNPHGVGFAWVDKSYVFVDKGYLKSKQAWEYYKNNCNIFPHVIHFRLGTSGAKSAELTHPFIISEKSSLKTKFKTRLNVLFHNGVIHNWEKYETPFSNEIRQKKVSDTRVMAYLIHKFGESVIARIGGGKYIIVDYKGTFTMYGTFIEHEGVKFSNYSYVSYRRPKEKVKSQSSLIDYYSGYDMDISDYMNWWKKQW